MKVVHKWPLPNPTNFVKMPPDGVVLTAQLQNGVILLWAEVEADVPASATRVFSVYTTGEAIDSSPHKYIATIQAGNYVYHVMERLS